MKNPTLMMIVTGIIVLMVVATLLTMYFYKPKDYKEEEKDKIAPNSSGYGTEYNSNEGYKYW